MKKIIKTLSLFLFISILAFGKLAAQDIDVVKSDKDRVVYWFYINVILHEDGKTGYVSYIVRNLGSRIYHAKINDYDRILWKNLGTGKKFAVGPFYDYEEARQAVMFYGKVKDEFKLDSTYNDTRNIHWFMLRVERRARSKSYVLKRIPGAIGQGTYERFYDSYKAGLVSKTLPIGPFWNMEEAEEAKRTYRLH